MSTKKVDPRDIAHPFTLPNGTAITLKHITQKDYEELDKWVRQQYMKNVTEATRYLNVVEKQEFLLAALGKAAKLTFQWGEGRDILFGSCYGMARLMYQMVQNPPFAFDAFRDMLYPDGFITLEGITLLGDMLSITTTGEIHDTTEKLVAAITENVTQQDKTVPAETAEPVKAAS